MSKDTPEMTAARIEAERARARLTDTAHDLQARLKPKPLAQNAWAVHVFHREHDKQNAPAGAAA